MPQEASVFRLYWQQVFNKPECLLYFSRELFDNFVKVFFLAHELPQAQLGVGLPSGGRRVAAAMPGIERLSDESFLSTSLSLEDIQDPCVDLFGMPTWPDVSDEIVADITATYDLASPPVSWRLTPFQYGVDCSDWRQAVLSSREGPAHSW